jgi:hypothetical protein
MTAQALVKELLELAQRVHPSYTREQQFIWISAILAEVVMEKNHMDNIVLARLNARLKRLAGNA